MERFEELYKKHAAVVFRYARSCVDRREIAEEIVSEVFLTLYQSLDRVDDGQLPAWLLTVTKRRAADYWRRYFVETKHLSWVSESPGQKNAAEPEVPLTLWLEQSPQLKPIHRACLILRYAHGMTREEIAERLALSETQVKGHLQYALELLRKDFQSVPGGAEK
jgi:RNA polymerase sigma-70 factor (ECF subfamily)